MEKIPAYKKCYNKLKSDIDNNVYPIGSYLPTEDELGKMFSVSRTTVRHAIDLLVKDKRIKVKQGAGTQVINPKERELTNFSKFHNVIDIHTLFPDDAALTISGTWIDRIPASSQVARALDLNEGTEVFRLQRVVFSNEQPVIIQTNYIRIDFFPDLDTYREQLVDLYYFIQKHYGIKLKLAKNTSTSAQLISLMHRFSTLNRDLLFFSTPERHTVHLVLWNTWKPGSVLICAIS